MNTSGRTENPMKLSQRMFGNLHLSLQNNGMNIASTVFLFCVILVRRLC